MPKSDTSTEKEIVKLTREMRKLNSFSRRFYLGVITGVGTALGATIVASIFFFILSRAVRTVEDIPIINDIITRLEIMDILENN